MSYKFMFSVVISQMKMKLWSLNRENKDEFITLHIPEVPKKTGCYN